MRLMSGLGRLTGQLLVRMVKAALLVVIVAGIPYGLLTQIGPPLPRRLPAAEDVLQALTEPVSDTLVLRLLAAAMWVLWTAFVACLVVEVAAAVRGVPTPRLRPVVPLQTLAGWLVAGVTAGLLAAAPVIGMPGHTRPALAQAPGPAGATDLPATTVVRTSTTHTAELPRFALAARTGPLTVAAAGRHYTVTVRRGDTLWDLAEAWLGDPYRWPEIYHLNAERYDRHGRMHHGDHIEPTWVLTLPDDATPPAGLQQDPGLQQEPGPQTGRGAGPSATPSGDAAAAPTTSATSPSSSASTAMPGGDPDGVVGAPPGAAPPSSGAASASPTLAAPTTRDPGPTGDPDQRAHRPPGVSLPSGSWLDLGLATAIAAAVALVWAHRRRRYTRRPPSADLRLGDPEVAAMPPVVNQIRRRLRHASQRTCDPADQQHPRDLDLDTMRGDALDESERAPATDGSADHGAGLGLLGPEPHGAADDRDVEPDEDGDTGDEAEDDFPTSASRADHAGDADPVQPRPAVPSLAHPLSAVWPPAGLGLTGAGAEAAARGFLAAALAAGGVDAPDERNWVVMPSATAATLLGADAVALPETPRLTVTAGPDEVLDLLEAQTLHRSRLVYAHEVDTVAELRAADPTEQPLPPILLLADATTRHQRTRIAALLAQGQRLDIHGVLLGAWPDGDTVVVAADGTTSRAGGDGSRHGGHPADIGRLAVLTPAETSDLLATFAESHTGRRQAPAPVEPAATIPGTHAAAPAGQDTDPRPQPAHASTDPATAPAGGPDAASPAAPEPLQTGAPDAGTAAPAGTGDNTGLTATGSASATAAAVEPGGVDRGDPTGAAAPAAAQAGAPGDGEPGKAPAAGSGTDAADDAVAAAAEDPAVPGRVEVTVLGPAGILDVPPGPTLRKKSLEVLVYLAVHDGQATAEAILDDLMPDVPASKAPGRLYTYVSDLRTVLRRTGGRGTYLTHPDQRYALNHDIVGVDLWRMRAAIRDAGHAGDPAVRITALRRAVDTYAGHLAEGADYEWIEPYREAVRQQVLDAYLTLVDALDGSPDEQVTVLDAAIRHNPYVEELYRQAMRARAALGHLDAIRTLRRAVTRALGEIDAEPADETIALAEQLVAGLQRPGRRPDLRPAPLSGTGTDDGAAA